MKIAMNKRASYALLAGATWVFNAHSFAGAVDGRVAIQDPTQSLFHVDLRAPVRVPLPNNLEAASTAKESDAPTVELTDLPVSYQELLTTAQTEFQPQSGILDMFVDLPPDSPNAAPVVMVAQTKQAQKPSAAMRTVGVCEPMANLPDDPYFGRAILGFDAVAVNYLAKYEKVNLATQTAKITLLQPPAHGKLIGGGTYVPDRGFFGGQDQVSALVELGGYQVKVIYFIKVQPQGTGGIATDDDEMISEFCGPKGRMWKISTTTPALQTILGANSGVVSDTSPYQLNSFTVNFR